MVKRETKASIKRAREAQRFEMITGWFSRHAIVEQSPRHVLFRGVRETADQYGRWEGAYWFEVTLLAGKMLLVHGDICHVLFAYHDSRDLCGAVNWMGCHPLGDSYVYEKAVIGMRVRTLSHDRVHVAHAALRAARALLWASPCPEREAPHACCLAKGHPGPHAAREDPGLVVVR